MGMEVFILHCLQLTGVQRSVMKIIKRLQFSICAMFFTSVMSLVADPYNPPPVNLLEKNMEGKVFALNPIPTSPRGAVDVNGSHIMRVDLKSKAVITYFNKDEKEFKPSYKFAIYNSYGFKLCAFEDKWAMDTIQPNAAYSREVFYYFDDLPHILEQTSIVLPPDWDKPTYLVINSEQSL